MTKNPRAVTKESAEYVVVITSDGGRYCVDNRGGQTAKDLAEVLSETDSYFEFQNGDDLVHVPGRHISTLIFTDKYED